MKSAADCLIFARTRTSWGEIIFYQGLGGGDLEDGEEDTWGRILRRILRRKVAAAATGCGSTSSSLVVSQGRNSSSLLPTSLLIFISHLTHRSPTVAHSHMYTVLSHHHARFLSVWQKVSELSPVHCSVYAIPAIPLQI